MPNLAYNKPVLRSQGFDPRNVQNCKLWLSTRAAFTLTTSSIPSVDGDVSDLWNDQIATYGYNMSLVGQKPTYKNGLQNNLPVLQFDGTDDYMVAPAGALSLAQNISSCTIVMAMNVVSLPAATGNIFNLTKGGDATLTRVNIACTSTGTRVINGRGLDADAGSSITTAGTFTVNRFEILVAQWDFTNKQGRIIRNGIVEADWTTFTNMTAGNTSNTASQAGNIAALNSSTYTNVQVGDIVFYQSLPSQSELAYLTHGLGHIWGVPGF
jgi:hypothetical protein